MLLWSMKAWACSSAQCKKHRLRGVSAALAVAGEPRGHAALGFGRRSCRRFGSAGRFRATATGVEANRRSAQLLFPRDVSAAADERPERHVLLTRWPHARVLDAGEPLDAEH